MDHIDHFMSFIWHFYLGVGWSKFQNSWIFSKSISSFSNTSSTTDGDLQTPEPILVLKEDNFLIHSSSIVYPSLGW